MWTATNDRIERPQIWDFLSQHDPDLTSAAWFGRHLKQCEAEYVCTEAPVHNPDGSESLWCYTRPSSYYGTLQEQLGHFPLMHFWGPMSNIQSTAWIADSAVVAARELTPRFFYIYLPHLDYAAQRTGPDARRPSWPSRNWTRSWADWPKDSGRPVGTSSSGWLPANTSSCRSTASLFPTASCARPAC